MEWPYPPGTPADGRSALVVTERLGLNDLQQIKNSDQKELRDAVLLRFFGKLHLHKFAVFYQYKRETHMSHAQNLSYSLYFLF